MKATSSESCFLNIVAKHADVDEFQIIFITAKVALMLDWTEVTMFLNGSRQEFETLST